MGKFWNNLQAFWDSRLKLSDLAELARKKTVPMHKHSYWYYFGGICLFLFFVQVITGILLLLYYTPTIDEAWKSILFIMSDVKFGWLIRSVHSWSANILIGAIFVHMFSTFFLKAYRPPRELTWVSGFFLLLIFLAFGFSGYLLPWNELSFFATRVGTDIIGVLPIIGQPLKHFVLGGPQVSAATLPRFFWFHVAVLPAITLFILGVHLFLVQIHGISRPVGYEEKKLKEIPFFPDFLLKDSVGWMLILGVIGILCVFFPWELGKEADLFAPTPLGIKPEWYFTFMFSTLKIIPSHILFIEGEVLAILAFLGGGLIWMLVPFLDRQAAQNKPSPWWTYLGIAVVIYIIVMTALTYLVPNL